MTSVKKATFIALGALILFLSACTSAGSEGLPGTGPLGTEFSLENPPQAVLDAQAWLADQLGVAVEDTQLVDVQKTEWQDSCLGLGGPAESCAQVVTPGWLVTVDVGGQQYEVRASEDGSIIRMAEGTPSGLE
jgi:hypothetical protein